MIPNPIRNLRLGTSSWTCPDWVGCFYPPGTKSADFLKHYAEQFDTVEVDSTYYRTPSESMVRNWRARTPEGFTFAAKVPQTITHEKVLLDCKEEFTEFLSVMGLLEDRLGPLLLQFPYFNRNAFATPQDFYCRLRPFVEGLPTEFRFALEVRNKQFVTPELLDLLRNKNIALALIDHPWMTPIAQLASRMDLVTADFVYVRWLGDRKGIEERTKTWNSIIVDRQAEMQAWIPVIRQILKREIPVSAYFNNHYAGFGPGSIALFSKVWESIKE